MYFMSVARILKIEEAIDHTKRKLIHSFLHKENGEHERQKEVNAHFFSIL